MGGLKLQLTSLLVGEVLPRGVNTFLEDGEAHDEHFGTLLGGWVVGVETIKT